MPDPGIVSTLMGASSVLGLLSVLAYFFFLQQARAAQRPLQDIVSRQGISNSPQVIKILTLFKDDESRLQALRELMHYDQHSAKALLDKVKANVDLTHISSLSSTAQLRASSLSATFFRLFRESSGGFRRIIAAEACRREP
jgi:hypothetical protein